MKLLCAALLALLSNPARGHGSMVHPRSRNSVDAFANVPAADRHTFGPCANISGGACDNGQSSFWYSQGCFIGCPTCDHVSGRRQTDVRTSSEIVLYVLVQRLCSAHSLHTLSLHAFALLTRVAHT